MLSRNPENKSENVGLNFQFVRSQDPAAGEDVVVYDHFTQLHGAIGNKVGVDVVKFFLDKGADINKVCTRTRSLNGQSLVAEVSAVDFALINGNDIEMLAFLISRGSRITDHQALNNRFDEAIITKNLNDAMFFKDNGAVMGQALIQPILNNNLLVSINNASNNLHLQNREDYYKSLEDAKNWVKLGAEVPNIQRMEGEINSSTKNIIRTLQKSLQPSMCCHIL